MENNKKPLRAGYKSSNFHEDFADTKASMTQSSNFHEGFADTKASMTQKLIRYGTGLRLIVEHIPSARSVSAGYWVGAGSSHEDDARSGISHFTEHMMFKGTDKLSAFDVARCFEDLGGNINAFTSKECTCYYVKSIDEAAEGCFSLLSDIFFDSVFDEGELDKERNVIIEEINMTEDSGEDICYDLISAARYKDSPLERTILGGIENVKKFKNADVTKFVDSMYTSDNTVIAFAGNITLEKADKLVKKYALSRFKNHKVNKKDAEFIQPKSNHAQRIKDFEQSNFILSFPSLKFNDPEYAKLNVINTILGGTMGSRLFQRIREQLGLAYSIYSAPSSYVSNGSLNIAANISVENTQKTLNAIAEEIDLILQKGITEDELTRAKTQLKAACVFSLESIQSVMTTSGKMLILTNTVHDIDKRIKDISNVNIKEINLFSQNLFSKTNPVSTAYVGKKYKGDFILKRETNTNV